jgi:cell division FtsZ-interacting protein ZapD
MFSVYGGKCLSCTAVHNWIEKFSQGRSKVANHARTDRTVQNATGAKTSMLRVSTSWQSDGISVAVLAKDMSKDKSFLQVRISLLFALYIHLCHIY